MSDVQAEESYQANTVVELKDELAARGLPTSGNKDELVARLEEDDTKRAAGESEAQIQTEEEAEVAAEGDPGTGIAVRAEEPGNDLELLAEEQPDYYPQRVYSPFELPANTAAAQAFVDANPHAVDPDLLLEPGRQELAVANIQDHVDTMAEAGVIVEDPRLGGGGGVTPPDPPEEEGPAVTSLSPSEGETGTQVTVTVTGTGFADTSTVEADGTAQTTTFTSDTQLEADFTPAAAGTVNFTVRNADDQESNDMPFTVQDPAPPEE